MFIIIMNIMLNQGTPQCLGCKVSTLLIQISPTPFSWLDGKHVCVQLST